MAKAAKSPKSKAAALKQPVAAVGAKAVALKRPAAADGVKAVALKRPAAAEADTEDAAGTRDRMTS